MAYGMYVCAYVYAETWWRGFDLTGTKGTKKGTT